MTRAELNRIRETTGAVTAADVARYQKEVGELAAMLRTYLHLFEEQGRRRSLAPLAFGYDYANEIGDRATAIAEAVFGKGSAYGIEIRKGAKLKEFHDERDKQ